MKQMVGFLLCGWVIWSGCAEDPHAPPAKTEEKPKSQPEAKSVEHSSPDSSVLTELQEMRNGLRNGQPQVLWYKLPADFRDDAESLVHEFADRVDEELWRNAFASWQKVRQILAEKSGYILALPEFEELSDDEQQRLQTRLQQTAGLLETILESDLSSLTKLRRISIGEFLKTNGSELLSSSSKSNEWIFPTDADPQVLAEDEQTTRIGWFRSGEETPTRVELWVRHGRHWVSADWLLVWEQIRLARQELKTTTEPLGAVAERLQSLQAADSVLTQLVTAKNESEFAEVWQRDVNDNVRTQIIGQLRGWAGIETPIVEAESATNPDSKSDPETGSSPITNATQADYVTIEVRGKLDEQAEDVLFLAFEAAIVGDADVLALPGEKNWTSQVGPVRDVEAFAKRLRIGRIVEVDAENRRIVLEWTDPTSFRTPD